MARYTDLFRRVATLVIVAAMLLPLVSNDDGLPLSTYPMYASTRAETLALITATGVASDGTPLRLTTSQIAQTRDPLIAQSLLNDAARSGTTGIVCEEIASRLDGQTAMVEIAREVHNVVAFVQNRASLIERTLLATCQVMP